MEGQKTTLHVVVIATLLAAVALATPILVDRHAPDRANAAGSSRQQVELADIAVPAADGAISSATPVRTIRTTTSGGTAATES